MTIQIIEKDGRPEWAVIPYAEYRGLLKRLERQADLEALEAARASLAAGTEERVSADMAQRLLTDNPFRAWREYRGHTLEAVAHGAGISRAYLSMIETGKRQPSDGTCQRLATALGVEVADLE